MLNIASETSYGSGSPAGTRWAFAGLNGNPANISANAYQSLTFLSWRDALEGNGNLQGNIVNRLGVVHLVALDLYLEIVFTRWGRSDGSFSYRRASSHMDIIEFRMLPDNKVRLQVTTLPGQGYDVLYSSALVPGSFATLMSLSAVNDYHQEVEITLPTSSRGFFRLRHTLP